LISRISRRRGLQGEAFTAMCSWYLTTKALQPLSIGRQGSFDLSGFPQAPRKDLPTRWGAAEDGVSDVTVGVACASEAPAKKGARGKGECPVSEDKLFRPGIRLLGRLAPRSIPNKRRWAMIFARVAGDLSQIDAGLALRQRDSVTAASLHQPDNPAIACRGACGRVPQG
jgi:hypothetical protein